MLTIQEFNKLKKKIRKIKDLDVEKVLNTIFEFTEGDASEIEKEEKIEKVQVPKKDENGLLKWKNRFRGVKNVSKK